MKLAPFILAAAALLLAPSLADAQTLRCGNGVVSSGDSKATVLQKCGEPALKDTFCKTPERPQVVVNASAGATTVVNVLPCENVDDWTYNPGYGKLMATLRFRAGTLRSITDGDRVK